MKRKFAIILSSLIVIASCITTSTYAWFAMNNKIDVADTQMNLVTSYFHCGSGTEDDPYVITRPIHLYNLSQLYDKLDGFADNEHYFQLGYDLDNSGSLKFYDYNSTGVIDDSYSTTLNMDMYDSILSIGSEEKPFKSHFAGNGLTVDNLTIEGNGIFEYVSSGATIDSVYFDDLTINVDHGGFTGYLASQVEDGTSFTNVYTNNSTLNNGVMDVQSDWGVFGYCENAASLQHFINKANGQGDEPTWGGSIQAIDYTALGYTLGPKSSSSFTKETTGPGGYKMVITASTNANPVNSQVVYRLRDTSFLPLKFGNDDHAHAKNTGYLVGSNVGTGVNASPKISSYKMANIGNALSNTAYTNMQTTYSSSTPNIPYDDSKLEVLTYYNNGWKRISDEHNSSNNTTNSQIKNYTKMNYSDMNLVKYKASRDSLQTILESSNFIHGIHFDNNQVSASNLLTIPANTARVDEVNYSSTYQVPKGSINFKLREKGFINFFAGTYNSSQVALNFFSLHQVNRNGGNISSIKEITQIYENTGSGNPYVYKYSDNTYSTGTRGDLVFDVATILKGNAPVVNMLYYFELPVNPGEYAMGVAGSTQGAYMIYLDLGAHGNEESGEEELTSFNTIDYRSSSDVSEFCPLIITYDNDQNKNGKVKVNFTNNNYYITTEDTNNFKIKITILNTDYNYYLNGTQLDSQIGSIERTIA